MRESFGSGLPPEFMTTESVPASGQGHEEHESGRKGMQFTEHRCGKQKCNWDYIQSNLLDGNPSH